MSQCLHENKSYFTREEDGRDGWGEGGTTSHIAEGYPPGDVQKSVFRRCSSDHSSVPVLLRAILRDKTSDLSSISMTLCVFFVLLCTKGSICSLWDNRENMPISLICLFLVAFNVWFNLYAKYCKIFALNFDKWVWERIELINRFGENSITSAFLLITLLRCIEFHAINFERATAF